MVEYHEAQKTWHRLNFKARWYPVAKLTGGQGGRPPPLAGHFKVFGPPVTTLLILLSDL